MKLKTKTLAMLILGVMSFGALTAKADILPIPTYNLMNKSVWITIYTFGQQTDWGCLPAYSQRGWWSGNYVPGVPYAVRGEVKENADCSGATLGDTGTMIQLPSVAWIDAQGKWHTTPLPPTMATDSQITDSVTQGTRYQDDASY